MGNQGNEEDLALMADVARGDENAFAKIVEKHQPAVLGTVAKMTNQSPDTEDIAQQVFIRLWKMRTKLLNWEVQYRSTTCQKR